MADEDRLRWDAKYARGEHAAAEPSCVFTALDSLLPTTGRALDLAGGAGRHAIWLAQRGLDVTLADISDRALESAGQRAVAAGVVLHLKQIDLEQEPFPPGPWDLIVSIHYCHRPLFKNFAEHLADRGMLVIIQPTVQNLERHAKPPRRFLLQQGELASLAHELHIIHLEEDWSAEGRHEAVLVARKESSTRD